MKQITIEIIDTIKDKIESLQERFIKNNPSIHYTDIRFEVSEDRGAFCENGDEKYCGMDYGLSCGVRVLAGKKCISPGYYGLTLGAECLTHLETTIEKCLNHAYQRALSNAEWKTKTQEQFPHLGQSLWNMELAPIEIHRDILSAEFQQDPASISPQQISTRIKDISQEIKSMGSTILYNQIGASTMLSREFFTSSEGAAIDQTFAITYGIAYIVASGKEGVQEHYDYIGHQRGWEVNIFLLCFTYSALSSKYPRPANCSTKSKRCRRRGGGDRW